MTAGRRRIERTACRVLLAVLVPFGASAGEVRVDRIDRDAARESIARMLAPDGPVGEALTLQTRRMSRVLGLSPYRKATLEELDEAPFRKVAVPPSWHLLGPFEDLLNPPTQAPPPVAVAEVPLPSPRPVQTAERAERLERGEVREIRRKRTERRRDIRRSSTAARQEAPTRRKVREKRQPEPEKRSFLEQLFGPAIPLPTSEGQGKAPSKRRP